MQLHLATLGVDSLLYSVLYGGYSYGLAVLACKSNASLKIHNNTHGDWRSNSIIILRALQISKIPAHSSTPIHHHHFCMHYSNQGVMSVEQSHLIIRLKKKQVQFLSTMIPIQSSKGNCPLHRTN